MIPIPTEIKSAERNDSHSKCNNHDDRKEEIQEIQEMYEVRNRIRKMD